MKQKGLQAIIFIMLIMLIPVGCGSSLSGTVADSVSSTTEVTVSPYVSDIGAYDSFDTSIVAKIEGGEVTFYNYDLQKTYTLKTNGATVLYDRYQTPISLAQLSVGDIVNVWFLREKKIAACICVSPDAFIEPDITGFEVNSWAKTLRIGDDTYRVNKATFVVSKDRQISLSELNPMDSITLRGNGVTVESIVVDVGHGYLSLANDELFVGGYIEIGPKLIYQIKEKQMLMVPEGDYNIRITKSGTEVLRAISVVRDEEAVMDLSDVEMSEVKTKSYTIVVKPTDAEIMIDDKVIDPKSPVISTYGMHKLVASAKGYKTLSKYFNVNEGTTEVSAFLLENNDVSGNDTESSTSTETGTSTSSETSTSSSAGNETSDSASNSTDTSDSTTTTVSNSDSVSASESTETGSTTSSSSETSAGTSEEGTPSKAYYVTIPTPSGVEIYWDGNYMGLAPLSFKKVEGTHVITLRKTGYETRSFTVTLTDSPENVSYSFDELSPKEQE